MKSLHPLEVRLAEGWDPASWRSRGVVLAVSGGADSVALLRAMAALCGNATAPLRSAHLNHKLRGAESDADAQFVAGLSRHLGIACNIEVIDAAAEARRRGESVETAGRSLRYAFLQRLAEQHGAGYVATAHTADDQVETILQRVVRGTGISGLAGIPRTRALGEAATLVRPLLGIRRAEVVSYLAALGQPYREDASNADVRYTRNRIRHDLLPQLRRDYNPAVDDALLRLGSLAAELWGGLIEPEVRRLMEQSVERSAAGVVLDCRVLAAANAYLIRELLVFIWRTQDWPRQEMGLTEWEHLKSMIQSPPPISPQRRLLPGAILAVREASTLTLAPARASLP